MITITQELKISIVITITWKYLISHIQLQFELIQL